MKFKLLTISLLGVLSLTLTACTLPWSSGSSSSASQKATLNIWGMWESPEVMKVLIDTYKQTHPNVTINYDDRSVLNATDYHDRVFTRINQADGPDIVVVHNSWVPYLKNSLSTMPSNLMTVDAYKKAFYPIATSSAVIDNNIYALPAFYDGLALVYNKKHFKEIDQLEPPTAWEEFRKLALSLTVRGNNDAIVRSGAAIGASNNIDFSSDILGMMLAQARINVPTDLDSRSARDALVFYTNFVKEDKIWDSNQIEASAAFAQEKVSMIFIPSWNLLDILRVRPDMDIGVAPVPQADANNPVSWGSFWMYSVPTASKNKQASWEFLQFLSSKEQELSQFKAASIYRQYGAPYALSELSTELATNQYLGALVKTAPFAKSNPFAARAGNTAAVNALKTAINSVLFGQNETEKDPTTALKAAKDAIVKASQ